MQSRELKSLLTVFGQAKEWQMQTTELKLLIVPHASEVIYVAVKI